MRVHHFTATLSPRDAVGFHTLAVDDLLREMGHRTTLYAQSIHPELTDRARHFRDQPDDPVPDVLLYQASTGSPVADHLLGRPEPLVLDYHNLTPAEAFDPWEPHIGAELDAGRRQLVRLARRAVAAVADSRFNADELVALGLDAVRVAPVLFDPPDPPQRIADPDRPPTVLFVGRLAPNKRQQDLIAAVADLRHRQPDARLVLIGASSSARYEEALRAFAAEVAPGGVDFAGSIPYADLVASYGTADVFVCLSDHEGFCVPVIEAMGAGLPVIAKATAVLPETVGDAGLLLTDPGPNDVATAIEQVLDDADLRAAMAEQGRRRAASFAPERTRAIMRAELGDILESLA
ncbi:MAG: glycosyltransferase family 4 protein [Actinomycetota bacterium]